MKNIRVWKPVRIFVSAGSWKNEMRTIDSFMEKLQEIGKETLDRKGRILLRYGYVARIIGKIRRKTGQKRKNKKNDRKELTK